MIYVALLKTDPDITLQGMRCLTTIAELYRVLPLADTTEIRLSDEFVANYFTPTGLAEFMDNVSQLNSKCKIVTSSEVRDLQISAINQICSFQTVGELIYMAESNPQLFKQVFRILVDHYRTAYSETLLANNKVASLQLQNSQAQTALSSLNETHKRLQEDYSTLLHKFTTLLERVNRGGVYHLDPDSLSYQIEHNKYRKILYFKEITRVRFVDSLVLSLQHILKSLWGVPARLLVIEPYYATDKVALYPTCVSTQDLTYADVYGSDIVMNGYDYSLMEDILQNPSNIEYLLILDRAGMHNPHVYGDNVEYLMIMSDLSDNIYNAQPDRIISYSPDTLHIPYVREFAKLNTEEKVGRYSSMPIVKGLLNLLGS